MKRVRERRMNAAELAELRERLLWTVTGRPGWWIGWALVVVTGAGLIAVGYVGYLPLVWVCVVAAGGIPVLLWWAFRRQRAGQEALHGRLRSLPGAQLAELFAPLRADDDPALRRWADALFVE